MHLYPLDSLPCLGLPRISPSFQTDARTLSQEELVLLQSAYVWMQTHNKAIALPQSVQGSYSELYFMLQCFEQTQILVRSSRHMFSDFVDAHRALYEQQQRGVFSQERLLDFDVLLHQDVYVLKAVIRNCAGFYYDLHHLSRLQGPAQGAALSADLGHAVAMEAMGASAEGDPDVL